MPRIARTRIVMPAALSADERRRLADALYAVHREVFDGVDRAAFARYVVDSTAERTWINLHENQAGDVVGYLAMHRFEKELRGEPTAVFRAEAGSLRAYRGGNANNRFYVETVLRTIAAHPDRRVFYLGSLVHPSSYALFASRFREVWPHRDSETPPALLAFMDELASEFGLDKVDPTRPLVRDVGWRTRETDTEREYWLHCDRPDARFFVAANPGYSGGHGLLTLVPLTLSNVGSFLTFLCRRGALRWLEATTATVQRTRLGARLLRPKVLRQLHAAPIFARSSQASLRSLARRSDVIPMPGGAYVIRKGEASDEMYLLSSGAAYVAVEDGAGERIVDELGSGAVFGEIAMLAGERRSASIRTATQSTLVRIPRAVVLDVMESDGSLRQGVWRTFTERRFDDLVREVARYRHVARKDRLAWLDRGTPRALPAGDTLSLAPGVLLFMLSGQFEVQHDAGWIAARGPLLLEVTRPLQVRAQLASRLVLLPPLGRLAATP